MTERWPSGDPEGCARSAADVKALAWLSVAIPAAVGKRLYEDLRATMRKRKEGPW